MLILEIALIVGFVCVAYMIAWLIAVSRSFRSGVMEDPVYRARFAKQEEYTGDRYLLCDQTFFVVCHDCGAIKKVFNKHGITIPTGRELDRIHPRMMN